jgi:hypothetical protein
MLGKPIADPPAKQQLTADSTTTTTTTPSAEKSEKPPEKEKSPEELERERELAKLAPLEGDAAITISTEFAGFETPTVAEYEHILSLFFFFFFFASCLKFPVCVDVLERIAVDEKKVRHMETMHPPPEKVFQNAALISILTR